MKLIENVSRSVSPISRRGFLHGALVSGVFVLSARFVPEPMWAAEGDAAAAPFEPSLWMSIAPDGTVTIVAHRSEMGCGSRTALPLIVADELDADWSKVKIEQAIGDPKYGEQDTDGSHSVRSSFDLMRQVGATGRVMLITAAAARWGVSSKECATEPHFVVHRASGRKLGYGEVAAAAAKLPVPKKEDVPLKERSQWRYIGKESNSLFDLPEIVTGKAIFGMDATMPGMVFASIEHPPVLGQKIKSYDDKDALKVPGVQKTLTIDTFKPPHQFQPLGGIAVIADNTWAAFKGRKSLKVEWDSSPHSVYNSGPYRKTLEATSRQPGKVVRNVGDVDAAFAKGGEPGFKIIEAEYYAPHLAHASMEPPVAVAEYRDGKVLAWAPTQNPQAVQETIASVLGIKKEDVTCHVTLLGGGFGRKSKPDQVAEAAVLSKQLGKPVKVVWSREDDIHFDFFHSVAAMYMKAAVGPDGKPTAWLQRTVYPPINSTFDASAVYADDEMGLGWNNLPFDIPNHRAENGPADYHVRIGWLRSVANIYHAFAIHSFADELAKSANKDSVQYLLDLIGPPRIVDLGLKGDEAEEAKNYPLDTARLRRVVEIVAEKSGWGKRVMNLGKGRGVGIAAHRSFLTYVATVVEVEVDSKGQVHIPNVWTALDAGTVVSPDNIRNQFEGAAVFGTSLALFGEITATNGVIDQSNFNNYQLTRMNRAPRHVDVQIVKSEAPPAGVGEPGVPPFAPALYNAVFAATGKRVRELPLSKTKLA
ncbi:MAG: molybdopterin cofactor-binding domain-containing protein [Terriglobales bacterium]|jgi:isoquinoline 1-oxidoreductase beta subunit